MLSGEKYLPPQGKYMTGADENRNILRTFIHTYRDLPVLWDTSLRDYTNRDKRAEAYEQLVPIYRYLKRDATVEDVKKKINTLRTNYRKELKVVESAKRVGSVHTPRCWTFHELDFLRNTEKFLAVGGTNMPPHHETMPFNENSQTQASFMDSPFYSYRQLVASSPMAPPNITEMFQKSFGNHAPKQEQDATPPMQHMGAAKHESSTGGGHHGAEHGAATKRQRVSPNATQNPEELLSIACDYLTSTFPEEESIVRTWTHKLKRMQREQRLLAEKFINEIIFEGESGTLHRGSVQVNTFEPFVRFEEQQQTEEPDKSQSPRVHTSTAPTSAAVAVGAATSAGTTSVGATPTQPYAPAPPEPEGKQMGGNEGGTFSYN